jgi:hypothetical protein
MVKGESLLWQWRCWQAKGAGAAQRKWVLSCIAGRDSDECDGEWEDWKGKMAKDS